MASPASFVGAKQIPASLLLLPLCLLLLLTLPPLLPAEEGEQALPILYNGYKLFLFELASSTKSHGKDGGGGEGILHLIGQLEATGNRLDANGQRMPLVDVWKVGPPVETKDGEHWQRVEVLVAPEFVGTFLALLANRKDIGRIQTLSEDIQKKIDEEKRAILRRKQQRRRRRALDSGGSANANDGLDLATYNSYKSISAHLERIGEENADFVELLNLTKTFEGRNLLGIKIGRKDGQPRPLLFIDAGVHAREWIAPAAALFAIDKIISALSTASDEVPTFVADFPASNVRMANANAPEPRERGLASILERLQLVFVPVANPDGYEYSRTRDRLWRKTRSRRNQSASVGHRWCVGADANRNWGHRWAESGASRSPCSNIFPGWSPFSEPEVRAIRDYLGGSQLAQLAAYISLHSFGQLILSPWGYTAAEKPHNFGEQRKLAQLAIEAIRASTGAEYTFGSIADLLYPASGTSIDYWQHRGVPYIYGVELRPEEVDNELHGFAIPEEQIEPAGKEVLALITKVGEYLQERRAEEEQRGMPPTLEEEKPTGT